MQLPGHFLITKLLILCPDIFPFQQAVGWTVASFGHADEESTWVTVHCEAELSTMEPIYLLFICSLQLFPKK